MGSDLTADQVSGDEKAGDHQPTAVMQTNFDPWSDITTIELDQTLGNCPLHRTIRCEWEVDGRPKLIGPWAFDIELTLDWGSVDARFPALIIQADLSAQIAGDHLAKTSALVLGNWRNGTIEMGSFPAPAKVALGANDIPAQPGRIRRDVDLPFIDHITIWRPSLSGLGGIISMPVELGLKRRDPSESAAS